MPEEFNSPEEYLAALRKSEAEHGLQKMNEQIMEKIFKLEACFARHEFFTKRLYKKHNSDDAEVRMAFIIKQLHSDGIFVCPCGSAWCHQCLERDTLNYLEDFNPIFEAYTEWCKKQR